MATQLQERSGRNNRLVVLLSDDEKRRIEKHARQAGVSIGEWVRSALDMFEATGDVPEELLAMVNEELRQALARTEQAVQRLEASEQAWAAYDEDAQRERVRTELERHWGDPERVMAIIRGGSA